MNYKIVVPRRENSEFLALAINGAWQLPEIEVGQGERIARAVTKAMRERLGLETVLLFGSNTEQMEGHNEYFGSSYLVLEPRDVNCSASRTRWIKRKPDCESMLQDSADALVISHALQLADAFDSGTRKGDFGRAGWIDDVMEWIQGQLQPHGNTLTGKFDQLSGSACATLVRFETQESAVWFRAYDPRNTAGFVTNVTIAEKHPGQTPKILAAQEKWHALLMEEVQGKRLDEMQDARVWAAALLEMSKLQVSHVADANVLVCQGFKDRRIDILLSDIGPFFELMEEVMARQPKTPPPVLTPSELRVIRDESCSAINRLLKGGIPASLLHGDVGPHNVLISAKGPVYIDWSEASVSHPFLFCEYMLEFIQKDHVNLISHKKDLMRVYAEPWKAFATETEISEAFQLTPILAPLFLALVTSTKIKLSTNTSSPHDKYLRSMVRLLQRRIADAQTMEMA